MWWDKLTLEEKKKYEKHPEYVKLRNFIESGGDEDTLKGTLFLYLVRRLKGTLRDDELRFLGGAIKKWKVLRFDYDFDRLYASKSVLTLAKEMIELDMLGKNK